MENFYKKRFYIFLILVYVINQKLKPIDGFYSNEVSYMSLFDSTLNLNPSTKILYGPITLTNSLDCLNRCNRDFQCRVVSILNNVCSYFSINSWNFTVSKQISSLVYVKLLDSEPMVKTYAYYSMVVLCK